MITEFLEFLNENFKHNKKEFVLLVGPPGSGKSTYIIKYRNIKIMIL